MSRWGAVFQALKARDASKRPVDTCDTCDTSSKTAAFGVKTGVDTWPTHEITFEDIQLSGGQVSTSVGNGFDTKNGSFATSVTNVASVNGVYLDFETLSRCSIKTAGTHLYVTDPTTEILILTWVSAGSNFNEWTPAQGFDEALAVPMTR